LARFRSFPESPFKVESNFYSIPIVAINFFSSWQEMVLADQDLTPREIFSRGEWIQTILWNLPWDLKWGQSGDRMSIKKKKDLAELAKSLILWSRKGDLDPRLADYESATLPLSYSGPIIHPRMRKPFYPKPPFLVKNMHEFFLLLS
jgi:hypothetical protein